MEQPAYARVKAHILDRIGQGAWAPSDRVPSENALVREFGVARMTVNRAVRELAQEGYLTRVKGGGTYVADRRTHGHPLRIRNIADEIAARGNQHSADVLELREITADPAAAEAFDVSTGASLFRSLIVHFENDEPVQVEERLVRPTVAPDYLRQDFSERTPYEYLIAVAPLAQAEHIVQATLPPPTVSRLLAMGQGEPCLLIRRRTWSADRVASTANLYHPGSRFELSGRFMPQEFQ